MRLVEGVFACALLIQYVVDSRVSCGSCRFVGPPVGENLPCGGREAEHVGGWERIGRERVEEN